MEYIIWCNYHTKRQSKKGMRFILLKIEWERALIGTRGTLKLLWTSISDLIFVNSEHNIEKANRIKDWDKEYQELLLQQVRDLIRK